MSTSAQITANQQNATRSTGPRTPEGKATSSQNATRHGLTSGFRLLPSEDPAAYDHLLASFEDEFNPQSEYAALLVNELAQSRWKLLRIDRLQAEALDLMLDPDSPSDSPETRIVKALGTPAVAYDRLERYRLHAERTCHRAHRELTRLRTQAQRDQFAAIDQQIESVLNAPLPNEPNFEAYRAALRNEPNPAPRFQPVEPPVSNSSKCYDAEDVRTGSRGA